jgi:hypothetical protein
MVTALALPPLKLLGRCRIAITECRKLSDPTAASTSQVRAFSKLLSTVKVVLSLCLYSSQAIFIIFNLSTRWWWLVSFTPLQLYPRGSVPGTHWTGGWVYLWADLYVVEKRKIFCLCQESTRTDQPVAHCYTNCAIANPVIIDSRKLDVAQVKYGTTYKNKCWDMTICICFAYFYVCKEQVIN